MVLMLRDGKICIMISEVSDIWCCSVDGGGDGYLQ